MLPRANALWWENKLIANRRRDVDTTKFLEERLWKVIRVWEHTPFDAAADEIEIAVRLRR